MHLKSETAKVFFFFLDTLDAPPVFWGFSFEQLTLYDMSVSLIDISLLLYAWMFVFENFVGTFIFPHPLVDLCLDGVLFPGRT